MKATRSGRAEDEAGFSVGGKLSIRIGLILFGLVATPLFVRNVYWKLREAKPLLGASILDSRRSDLGAAYADGIESIREEIPRDGSYLLVDDSKGAGGDYWVRFDLAPRKAWHMGNMDDSIRRIGWSPPRDAPEFLVIARGADLAPELMRTVDLVRSPRTTVEGHEDPTIPGWIDGPEPQALVKGELRVVGWCQELGRGPCSELLFWMDGRPLKAERVERFPRPDVEAAVKGMGPCPRAGYRAYFRMSGAQVGIHHLEMVARCEGGRSRLFPAREFRWEP